MALRAALTRVARATTSAPRSFTTSALHRASTAERDAADAAARAAGPTDSASEAQLASITEFVAKFDALKPISTMADPATMTQFFKSVARERPEVTPAQMTLNFYVPHEIEFNGVLVDQVEIPAVTGNFGILPGHVPTMRPGVVVVQKSATESLKYFVSSGFAFVHADSSTDIVAVEAFPLEQLDPEAVKKGLADYTAKLAAASDDYEKVCGAMESALADVGVKA